MEGEMWGGGGTEAEAVFFISFHQPPPACVSPLPSSVSPARKSPFSLWLICMQIRGATQMRRAGRGEEGRVKVSGRWGEDRKKSQGNGRKEKERKGGGDAGTFSPPGSKLRFSIGSTTSRRTPGGV